MPSSTRGSAIDPGERAPVRDAAPWRVMGFRRVDLF
jgi:hypothetical protein